MKYQKITINSRCFLKTTVFSQINCILIIHTHKFIIKAINMKTSKFSLNFSILLFLAIAASLLMLCSGCSSSKDNENQQSVIIFLPAITDKPFPQGRSIQFEASADNFPDELKDSSFIWMSDINGRIGSGPAISTDSLSEGSHVTTATVTDSSGLSASHSRNITVTMVCRADLYDLDTRISKEPMTIEELDTILKTTRELSFKNLSEIKANGKDFNKVDLKNSFMVYADLSSADLSGAILSNAHLADSNLSGANMKDANFSNTDLTNANLTGADLTGANMSKCILKNAILSGANLSGVKLFKAADLTGIRLTGANLDKANLREVKLQGIDAENAVMTNADLSSVDFRGALLSNADLSGAKMLRINLANAEMTGIKMKGVDINNTDLQECEMSKADLSGAVMYSVNFSGANLNSANLSDTNLQHAIFHDAILSNANLTNADLKNADFKGTDVENTIFTGSDMNSMKNFEHTINTDTIKK